MYARTYTNRASFRKVPGGGGVHGGTKDILVIHVRGKIAEYVYIRTYAHLSHMHTYINMYTYTVQTHISMRVQLQPTVKPLIRHSTGLEKSDRLGGCRITE